MRLFGSRYVFRVQAGVEFRPHALTVGLHWDTYGFPSGALWVFSLALYVIPALPVVIRVRRFRMKR